MKIKAFLERKLSQRQYALFMSFFYTFVDRYLHAKWYIRGRLKLFWSRLWIRKNEFHSSLDMDVQFMFTMNERQQEKYLDDLTRRRNVAHRRDMELQESLLSKTTS
ncbi:hypothetical protein COB64_02930 [Candidatus Wolfebacteria bacterium]|nr:MAG: hypothetical protein COB64_02930 [Candidatus Wolfebacteria bacterium]